MQGISLQHHSVACLQVFSKKYFALKIVYEVVKLAVTFCSLLPLTSVLHFPSRKLLNRRKAVTQAEGKENKQRLQTFQINNYNAWSKTLNCINLRCQLRCQFVFLLKLKWTKNKNIFKWHLPAHFPYLVKLWYIRKPCSFEKMRRSHLKLRIFYTIRVKE